MNGARRAGRGAGERGQHQRGALALTPTEHRRHDAREPRRGRLDHHRRGELNGHRRGRLHHREGEINEAPDNTRQEAGDRHTGGDLSGAPSAGGLDELSGGLGRKEGGHIEREGEGEAVSGHRRLTHSQAGLR